MKYIKLYEAFKATILSKMNSYLKSSGVNERSKSRFLEDLNKIFSSFGVPIDKIEDSDIIYKSRNELYPIKGEEFDNEFGVYGLKFWFSHEGDYIGKSAIGNFKQADFKGDDDSLLPDDLFNLVKSWGFVKGTLTPVERSLESYSELETGMRVFCFLDEYQYGDASEERLTEGIIYRNGGYVYILHDNDECDGNYPDTDDWEEHGHSYGWGISDNGRVFPDHHYLCVYKPDDQPLEYSFNREMDKGTSDNPDEYNVDISDSGRIETFKSKNFVKIKNDADFGIFINLDKILKRGGFENPSDTRAKRQISKSGIIGGPHGLSNDELKEINIKRYSDLIITRYGISTEGVNFDKLNVFLANLMSEYFIFDVIGSRNLITTRFQNLLRIIQDLILSIKTNNKSEVERYFDMLISTINMIKLSKKEFENFDNRIYGILEENEKFGNLLLTIKEVGKYNVDRLKSTSLDNLYSLEMLSKKYSTIRNHIQGSYDSDMQKMNRLVTTFVHGTDYSENWDGLSSVNFDNCIDIVKSIKVFL